MTQVLRGRRSAALARVAAATAVCLVSGTVLAPAASADPFTDGQWYVTPFKLVANHAIADGEGVTVALLDGMISPTAPNLAGADVVAAPTPCYSESGQRSSTGTGTAADHATTMAAMIVGQGGGTRPLGVAPGAKLLTYTIGFPDEENPFGLACYDKPGGTASQSDTTAGDAIRDAVAKGARIINMSYGGRNASAATQVAIQYAEQKGVVFVASTNDYDLQAGQTRVIPPGSFNGVVLVNGIDRNAKLIANSATGKPDGPLVVAAAPGEGLTLGGYDASGAYTTTQTSNGSSPATAFVSGVLATTLSKWPKATGNQLIQSLARNTGGEEHEIDARALDGYGYGVVSLTSMLAHDPTAYPDENPTLRDGAVPSTGDILGSATTSPSDSPAPSSSGAGSGSDVASSSPQVAATPASSEGGSSIGLIIGIVVGAVVLLALVALVVVLASRRGRRGGPPPPAPGPPSYAPGGYAR